MKYLKDFRPKVISHNKVSVSIELMLKEMVRFPVAAVCMPFSTLIHTKVHMSLETIEKFTHKRVEGLVDDVEAEVGAIINTIVVEVEEVVGEDIQDKKFTI